MSACLIPLIVIVWCAAPGLPGLMSLYHPSVVRVTTPPHQLMSSAAQSPVFSMILTPVRWVTGQLAVSQENAPHIWGQITSRLRNGPAHATCLTLRLAALIRVQSNLISTSELSSPPGYIGADMGQGRERVHTWQSAQSVSSLCNVQQVSALCSLNKALQSPDCRHVTMLIHAWLLTQCYNKHRPGCKAVFAQVSLLWCDGRLIGCNESNIDSGSLHTGISSRNGWH